MNAQQAANLRSARRLAASRLGMLGDYGEIETDAIPYAFRERYANELAKIIAALPDRFDALTVANARRELADTPNAVLEDYTAADAARDFASGAAQGAGSVVNAAAGVGEGVKSALSLARWLIPVALVVGVALWLWRAAGSPALSRRSA